MSEKYPSFDENSPEFAERLALLEEINVAATEQYDTWGKLYEGLGRQVKLFLSNPCEVTAELTISLLYSFVLALADLPECGDAIVIGRKLNEIMLMHPERTGVAVTIWREGSTTAQGTDTQNARSVIEEELASMALRERNAKGSTLH
jgi:hypothetical protein